MRSRAEPSSDHSDPPPASRFIAGDPLRGIAALGVVLLHAAGFTAIMAGDFSGQGLSLLEAAYGTAFTSLMFGCGTGVLVFFVLSGYLIGGRYVRQAVELRPIQPAGVFLRNRILRIFPVYWVVLAATTIFYGVLLGEAPVSLGDVLELSVFHMSATNPLLTWLPQIWTLAVEVKFYAATAIAAVTLIPAIRRIPGGTGARTAVVVVPCLGWILYAAFLSDLGSSPTSFGYCLCLLLAGTALGAIEPIARPRLAGRAAAGPIGAAIAIAGATYVFAVVWLDAAVGGVVDPRDGAVMVIVITAIVAGPLIAQWGTGRCWRALDNRALRWLGTRSYSLYLVHLAVQWGIIRLLADRGVGDTTVLVVVIPTSIVVSLAISDVLYRTVELPFLSRKRRGRDAVAPGGRARLSRRRPSPAPRRDAPAAGSSPARPWSNREGAPARAPVKRSSR